jgi:hypothetical protein
MGYSREMLLKGYILWKTNEKVIAKWDFLLLNLVTVKERWKEN